jgi:uncharacterized integral membrane protein (TIGR00697 family)
MKDFAKIFAMNHLYFFIHLLIVLLFLRVSLFFKKNGLVTFVVLSVLFANFFILKQIRLFGFQVTCSDLYVVASFLGLAILQEKENEKACLEAMLLSFFAAIFFLVMGQMHLLYIPLQQDHYEQSYQILLKQNPRIVIVSVISYVLAQGVQVFSLYLLKKWPLFIKMLIATIITQVFDTIFFTFFALWKIAANLIHIMILSIIVKAMMLGMIIPLMTYFLKKHKKMEEVV